MYISQFVLGSIATICAEFFLLLGYCMLNMNGSGEEDENNDRID